MNRSILRISALTILIAAIAQQIIAADAAPGTQADKDWQAYKDAYNAEPPKTDKEPSPKETEEWVEQYFLQARTLGLAFIEKHPADPRRWKVVLNFNPDYPRFVKEWGALDATGTPTNNIVDKAAAAAWKSKVAELRATMAEADDLTPELRGALAAEEAKKPFETALEAQEKGEPVDLPGLRTKLQDFAKEHPEGHGGEELMFYFATLVERCGLVHYQTEFALLADSPNKEVAKMAKAKLAFAKLAEKPLDIAFTAVDGRAVDLQKLRGKVVLVDFWATWCGPCVAELPNVKKAYDEFHNKGFEVVGISLEMAQFDEKDTPEQHAAKLAAAKKKLTGFIAQRKIPWPQYFDGKGWKNEIAANYALSGIPAMFLLDQEGRIVTTGAQGDELAKGVKRLLKL